MFASGWFHANHIFLDYDSLSRPLLQSWLLNESQGFSPSGTEQKENKGLPGHAHFVSY